MKYLKYFLGLLVAGCMFAMLSLNALADDSIILNSVYDQDVIVYDSSEEVVFEVEIENPVGDEIFAWYLVDKWGTILDYNPLGNGSAFIVHGIPSEQMLETQYYKVTVQRSSSSAFAEMYFSCMLAPIGIEDDFEEVISLELTKAPTKMEYYVGETVDLTGSVFRALTGDGFIDIHDGEGIVCVPEVFTEVGNTEVDAYYGGTYYPLLLRCIENPKTSTPDAGPGSGIGSNYSTSTETSTEPDSSAVSTVSTETATSVSTESSTGTTTAESTVSASVALPTTSNTTEVQAAPTVSTGTDVASPSGIKALGPWILGGVALLCVTALAITLIVAKKKK